VQIFVKLEVPRKLEARVTAKGKRYTREALVAAYETRTKRFARAFDASAKVDSVQNIDRLEFQKQVLSMLIRQPPMVCFDNIADGATLDSPQVAQLLTNPFFSGRILGVSQDITVPTNVPFVFTDPTRHAALARELQELKPPDPNAPPPAREPTEV
jgi:hypothetical protein